jgi:hypothetical protein
MRNQAEAEAVLAATKRYAAAYAHYQRCLRALIQVARSGERPPRVLVDKEAAAVRRLAKVRAGLLKAMGELVDSSAAAPVRKLRLVKR